MLIRSRLNDEYDVVLRSECLGPRSEKDIHALSRKTRRHMKKTKIVGERKPLRDRTAFPIALLLGPHDLIDTIANDSDRNVNPVVAKNFGHEATGDVNQVERRVDGVKIFRRKSAFFPGIASKSSQLAFHIRHDRRVEIAQSHIWA